MLHYDVFTMFHSTAVVSATMTVSACLLPLSWTEDLQLLLNLPPALVMP